MEGILTLDVGTSSMRGIIFSTQGQIITASQIPTSPRFLNNGRVEQHPHVWRDALYAILKELSSVIRDKHIEIQAVSLTSFRSPVFPVDEQGEPLADALMWQDRRTQYLCDRLNTEHGLHEQDWVFEKTGLIVSPVFSGIKMLWFQENYPELSSRTRKYLGVHEYILYLLTGSWSTDHSVASRSNLFNLHTLDWDDELLKLFSVDRSLLCDLFPPGTSCGGIRDAVSREYSLPQGTPVICAGGDQQSAALGLGIIRPGVIEANTGTGSYIIGSSDKPVIDPQKRIFCNVSAIPDTYILEAGILTSGTVYRWFSEQFYDPLYEGENVFPRVDREIQQSPPGSNGVIALPHFEGAGAPKWNTDAAGLFFNINLSTTRGDMARAVLEGIAMEISENADLIQAFTGEAEYISASGGMTKFPEYNHMQADICGKPVIRYKNSEATSIGAWMNAAVHLGVFSNYADAFAAAVGREAPGGAVSEAAEDSGGDSYTLYSPNPERFSMYRELKRRKEALYHALDREQVYTLFSEISPEGSVG